MEKMIRAEMRTLGTDKWPHRWMIESWMFPLHLVREGGNVEEQREGRRIDRHVLTRRGGL